MMVWGGYNWGWGSWLLMTFSMVVVWGLLIGALIALLRAGLDRRSGTLAGRPVNGSAQRILAEGYAHSDLDKGRGDLGEEGYPHPGAPRDRRNPTGLAKVG